MQRTFPCGSSASLAVCYRGQRRECPLCLLAFHSKCAGAMADCELMAGTLAKMGTPPGDAVLPEHLDMGMCCKPCRVWLASANPR